MKTLRPKWNEPFVLTARASDNGTGGVVTFVVEDWDLTKNDFIGACDVRLDELVDQQVHRVWLKLLSKERREDKPRGHVEVVLRWVFSQARDLRHFTNDDDGRPDQPPNELRVAVIQVLRGKACLLLYNLFTATR
jgi:Ca2+-dependent lipid-binding protein